VAMGGSGARVVVCVVCGVCVGCVCGVCVWGVCVCMRLEAYMAMPSS
jgi:hypothetical protein